MKRSLSAEQKQVLQTDTEAILSGDFEMLGVAFEAPGSWSHDPPSDSLWPTDRHPHRIETRSGGRDIKLAWELHRLQHLQILAFVGVLLGYDGARTGCIQLLSDWLQQHTMVQGVAYAGGIECASRIFSFLVIAGLLQDEVQQAGLGPELWRAHSRHARVIERYPSRFSSSNNHRIAELCGLFILGCCAPGHPSRSRWLGVAKELRQVALQQFHPDGVGVEQSPTYQAYTMEWLFLARQAGHRVGVTLEVDGVLARGRRFLKAMSDVSGNIPAIGDDDEGVVLRQSLRPDIVRSLSRPHRTRGSDIRGMVVGETPDDASPRQDHRCFEQGGISILRQDVDGSTFQAWFDHGPLGFAPLAAHGHADALAVWLHVDGRPILVDSGTYRYNGAPAWREWARSTLAHNTVCVEGRDQSPQRGPFLWGRPAVSRLLQKGDGGMVIAQHDGTGPLAWFIAGRWV